MIKEIDLAKLIAEMDDQLMEERCPLSKRPFVAYMRLKQRWEPHDMCTAQNDSMYIAIEYFYEGLYRPSDLQVKPVHLGAFMFRDVFFPLRISRVCGAKRTINPISLLGDISETQKQWLLADEQTVLTFYDQVIDLMDFSCGLEDLAGGESLSKETLEFWDLAKRQLEAAAAMVLGTFDKDPVIQNCCLSIELLLKGALAAQGISKEMLKDQKQGYGHNLKNLANKTAEFLPNFDGETVLFVIQQLPGYVSSRYEAEQISQLELGRFLMYAQFVSGEVLRQFSDRNSRAHLTTRSGHDWDLTCRIFPRKTD
jgi:hypothetical protein